MSNNNIPQAFLDILEVPPSIKQGGIDAARRELQAVVPLSLIQERVKPTASLKKDHLNTSERYDITLTGARKQHGIGTKKTLDLACDGFVRAETFKSRNQFLDMVSAYPHLRKAGFTKVDWYEAVYLYVFVPTVAREYGVNQLYHLRFLRHCRRRNTTPIELPTAPAGSVPLILPGP